jgi:DNA repair protein RecO (recombination protein O)
VCRRPGPHAFLSVKAGGVLCADCAPVGTRAVTPPTIRLLSLLAAPGEWASLPAAAAADDEARRVAASYVRAFVEHHLDRRLRSYELVPRP